MKKIFSIILCVCLMFCLTGCGETIGKIKLNSGENGFYIKKDGTVLYAVSESFDKKYYDKDELKKAIEEEVKSYNESNVASVSDSIKVEKIKVSRKKANMTLKFATIYDFDSYIDKYNKAEDEKFYVGAVAANPYDISGDLVSTDKKKTIKAEDVEGMNADIIVTDEKSKIQVDGDILYISEKCTVDKKGIVTTADDGISYVVYSLK